jgi:thiamine pyrophosphokinase
MSSHHIIREKQEPALIIANGAQCHSELIGQLLEWSPYIVVLDGALERVLKLGIHFDVVIGDLDSLSEQDAVHLKQMHIPILHRPDQEKTDLQKGIEYLIEKDHKAVNIIWATGMRADHTFNNICTLGLYKDEINACLLDDHSRIFVLPRAFRKKYNPGEIISLIPLGTVNGITTRGLKYSLDDEALSTDGRSGSSNEVSGDGWVEITYKS